MSTKTLLLTGATGYIGSHSVVAFEQAWYKAVIIDNLVNSSRDSLRGIENILGYSPDFYEWDIGDREFLRKVFSKYDFDWVVHFAGLKAVGESCENPLYYHKNNVSGSIELFEVMEKFSVRKIIFSSSATVYREDNIPPFTENMPLGTTNPYGTTKLVIEYLLWDLAMQKNWSVTSLRYFNPIGAHESGEIGETPNGIPNNLLPYILDVAIGKRKKVMVFGDKYDTIDGTGVRDYIDVWDLVMAHIAAYESLTPGYEAINIGTGKGTSVLEMIAFVEKAAGKNIPYEIVSPRPWDLGSVFCDPFYAKKKLHWEANITIEESVTRSWKFIQKNSWKNLW